MPYNFTHLIVISEMTMFYKICPVVPSRLSHVPRICLSISRNLLINILLQGLWLLRVSIITIIKVSCMGLDQNIVPTGTVKNISAILCNLFCHLYGSSFWSIVIWAREGLLLIPRSNSFIYVPIEVGGRIHMKKPYLVFTGILCPSYWVNFPVTNGPF